MKIYLLIFSIIIREIENIKYLIDRVFFYKKNISLTNLISSKLINKDANIYKGNYFQKFIDYSKKFNLKFKDNKSNNYILVENFVNHPYYTYANIISAKFLNEYFNYKLLGVLREGDFRAKLIFQAFGVEKFFILKKQNLLSRIYYSIKAVCLVRNNINISDFCKITYNRIEIGYSTYDSYIRYTGDSSLKKVNPKLISMLSTCMHDCDELKKKLFVKKNIKISIQSETVFNPLNSFFQLSLLNKINIFSRCGQNEISLRHYTNWKQRNTYRYNISQKIFNVIKKKNKKKIHNWFNGFKNKSYKSKNFGIDLRIAKFYKRNKKILNKQQLTNYFNWSNKKIVVFFFNHFIDRNYHNGPRINFSDSYSWTKYALDKIKNKKSVNWILKPHPTEKFYSSKKNLDRKISEIINKHKNIKLFPNDLNNLTLLKSADFAVTSNGSVGMEYPAFGIGCVYTEKSTYSNLAFTKPIKGKGNINHFFKNIEHHITKPKDDYIFNCKAYLYIQKKTLLSNCTLLPKEDISRAINEENFWNKCTSLQRKFAFGDDVFFKMLGIQLKYKMRHTFNLDKDKIKISRKLYEDYID